MSKERKGPRTHHGYHNRRSLTRRQLLFGAAGGGLAALGIGIIASENSRRKNTDPEEVSKVISAEIRRSKTAPDLSEQQLWQNAYQRTRITSPSTEETYPQVLTRFNQTVQNMTASKNKYLRHAAEVLLSQQNSLIISVHDSLRSGNIERHMGIGSIIHDNRFARDLVIDQDLALNNSNGLSFAISLAHEAQHLEDSISFQNTLPENLTPQERVGRETARLQSDYIIGEARAYATESETLLESLRLGVTTELPYSMLYVAAEYVKAGKNRDNHDWKDFIANNVPRQ